MDNNLMDLDVLFEDLEAQGYFHSLPKEQAAPTKNCRLVRVDLQSSSHLLSSPLLGLDFIAGFELQNNKIRWLIIPINRIQLIQAVEQGTSMLETESNLGSLIETKLLGTKIKVINSEKTIHGIPLSSSKNWLRLQSDELLWLPLTSLGVIVVEKFSDLT